MELSLRISQNEKIYIFNVVDIESVKFDEMNFYIDGKAFKNGTNISAIFEKKPYYCSYSTPIKNESQFLDLKYWIVDQIKKYILESRTIFN